MTYVGEKEQSILGYILCIHNHHNTLTQLVIEVTHVTPQLGKSDYVSCSSFKGRQKRLIFISYALQSK